MRSFNLYVEIFIASLSATYFPILLLVFLGAPFSPFNSQASWGLAAEHSELGLEHISHFIIVFVAAIPVIVSLKFIRLRIFRLVALSSIFLTAIIYAIQPTHSFLANDGWLANYTWQIAALEILIAPFCTFLAIAWAALLMRNISR